MLHIYPLPLLHGDRVIRRVSLGRSLPSGALTPLPLLPVEPMDLMSKARGQSCSWALSLPIPAAHRDLEHHPRRAKGRTGCSWQQGGCGSHPRIPSLLGVPESSQHTGELTVVRPTCCSCPPSLAAVAGAGRKGQAVKVKLLLEPLKMQTNTGGRIRYLLGRGRAIKK